MGGWDGWGRIEIKDHLSPAKAEIGAELGNIIDEKLNKSLGARLVHQTNLIVKIFYSLNHILRGGRGASILLWKISLFSIGKWYQRGVKAVCKFMFNKLGPYQRDFRSKKILG